jgi:hypothetical protein
LGIAPYGDALKIAVQGAVDAAAAFLSRICNPAAEEVGLLLRDRVRVWRAKNFVAMAQHAERLLQAPDAHAHPSLVHSIAEHASWTDDSRVQEMWAGLLVSACTPDGKDESNKIFVRCLEQLTGLQARILFHACTNCRKFRTTEGLVYAYDLTVSHEELVAISGVDDTDRLDRELDDLRQMGLLQARSGFDADDPSLQAHITPAPLSLHFYVRCQGSRKSPIDFFDITTLDSLDSARWSAHSSRD